MTETNDTPATTPQTGELQKTKLSKRWIRKFAIFLVVCIGFGFYGLYDATIAYPKRGENDASYRLFKYLEAADEAHRFALSVGVPEGQTPQEHLAELEAQQAELNERAGGEGGTARDARAELAKLEWLDALAKVWQLTPERVEADLDREPSEILAELKTTWDAKEQPKPLSWFDIPVQWLFTVVGFGLGIWLAIHMVRVASKSYTWNPGELRLGLPGGHSIVPADVAEFDKRKWDKFLFFFKIKPDHPELGGRELKLDLYQYSPLEDWCVEMHKHARPEDYADEDTDDGTRDAAPESAEPSSEEVSSEPHG